MRLSVDRDDSGFLEWAKLGTGRFAVKIFLDGVEIRDVITADEEAGMLVRYVRDGNSFAIDRDINGRQFVRRETLYGVVELH